MKDPVTHVIHNMIEHIQSLESKLEQLGQSAEPVDKVIYSQDELPDLGKNDLE